MRKELKLLYLTAIALVLGAAVFIVNRERPRELSDTTIPRSAENVITDLPKTITSKPLHPALEPASLLAAAESLRLNFEFVPSPEVEQMLENCIPDYESLPLDSNVLTRAWQELQKRGGQIKRTRIDFENIHFENSNARRLRLKLEKQEAAEVATTPRLELRYFSEDSEGLPSPQATPPEFSNRSPREVVESLSQQERLVFHEISEEVELNDGSLWTVVWESGRVKTLLAAMPTTSKSTQARTLLCDPDLNKNTLECTCR